MARRAFTLTGLGQLRRALNQAGDLAGDALEAALVEEANETMADSKQQTPVDTGRLRATGTVFPVERSGGNVSIEMGYGTDYAVPVHEKMGVHHPTGNAKFLERPLLERAAQMPVRLAAKVRANWQRLRVFR